MFHRYGYHEQQFTWHTKPNSFDRRKPYCTVTLEREGKDFGDYDCIEAMGSTLAIALRKAVKELRRRCEK
jgi:hypothetical protein